jgi:peptidoglycan-associated lipoprotein
MRNTTNTLLLTGMLILSACTSTSLDTTKAPVEDRSTGTKTNDSSNVTAQSVSKPNVSAAVIESRAVETVTATNTPAKNDALGMPAKRSVYFDYDSFVVKNEFKPVLEAHAHYLTTKKTPKIIIQGNTDERGGREYNLALGQKRAEAVRKSLSLLNVPESQMEAVSFGEEKPKARSSNEPSWAENRRVDIVY